MTKKSKVGQKIRPITTSKTVEANNEPSKNIDKAYKTWQLLAVGCTLVTAGFGAGLYIGYNNSKIENQDKVNEYRERIIEIGKEHEKEIHDYIIEISKLTDENNDLKNQIRQLKPKKK